MMRRAGARAIFRADGGPGLGLGHLSRCGAIAAQLAARGWEVVLATQEGSRQTASHLFDGTVVPVAGGPPGLRKAFSAGCDVLVVDHYDWGRPEESALRGWAGKIAVLDDLANRAHDADLLVDPSDAARSEVYAGLLPQTAVALCGPAYAPLRHEFADARIVMGDKCYSDTLNVLIAMGGVDSKNATCTAIDALARLSDDGCVPFQVTIVLPESAPHHAGVGKRMQVLDVRVTLQDKWPDMAPLLAGADLCIGAGGSSVWERCCLGLPSVIVLLAENQSATAAAASRAGAAVVCGLAADDIARAAGALMNAAPQRAAMRTAALALCDGQGAHRVAAAIEELATASENAGARMIGAGNGNV